MTALDVHVTIALGEVRYEIRCLMERALELADRIEALEAAARTQDAEMLARIERGENVLVFPGGHDGEPDHG